MHADMQGMQCWGKARAEDSLADLAEKYNDLGQFCRGSLWDLGFFSDTEGLKKIFAELVLIYICIFLILH